MAMGTIVWLACFSVFLSAVSASPLEPYSLRELRRNILFPHGRIVGGVDTDIRKIPYTVALEYGKFQFCGGTLISENHVLTAAHCINSFAMQFKIRAGASNRTTGGTVLGVSSVHVHPGYDPEARVTDFDAAILVLSSKISVSDTVKPIQVVDSEPEPNSIFEISGWGATKEGGLSSWTLKSVQIPVISRSQCQQMYSSFKVDISPRMICAFSLGKDSCQGDSGGPAVVNGKIGGIVSWGVGCARPNYPGVYTNVANPDIRSFIRTHAKV